MKQQELNRKIAAKDARYEKVWEQMELLGIQDVTTNRQHRNGTRVWRLPIKINYPGNNERFIEVASFKSGYVRNQNCGYSNYQLNKRYFEDEYFKDYDWDENAVRQPWNGKYRKFRTKKCILIPKEIDRLEYLIKYCVKNYYIKNANQVTNGEFIPKWKYEAYKDEHSKLASIINKTENPEIKVIVNGQRYNVI